MNIEAISLINTILNENKVLTCKSLSTIAGLSMQDAIKSLDEYRKLKSGEDLHAVYFLSGISKNVNTNNLVKEEEKGKHLAELDVVLSEHLYSISIGSPMTKKLDRSSKVERETLNKSNNGQRELKQQPITMFLQHHEPLMLQKPMKATKLKLLKGQMGNQLSIKKYLFKKQPYQIKSEWLDKLNMDFLELESTNGDPKIENTQHSPRQEDVEFDSSDDSCLNLFMDVKDSENDWKGDKDGDNDYDWKLDKARDSDNEWKLVEAGYSDIDLKLVEVGDRDNEWKLVEAGYSDNDWKQVKAGDSDNDWKLDKDGDDLLLSIPM